MKPGKPITCPHCQRQAIFEALPEGYATGKWAGNVKEEPYVRCPICKATFPEWGIDQYLKTNG